jgi:hypothetical protein
MPYLFVKNYEVDLMHMNKSLYHIYIESQLEELAGKGAYARCVFTRMACP